MSLYGYGPAYYVVESSLGIPIGYVGKLQWQTTRMFGEAAMVEPWDGVGKAAMAEPTRHKSGRPGGCIAHTGSETSVGMLQAR
jgi:hypothetical protein